MIFPDNGKRAELGLFIDGKMRSGRGATYELIDPATETVLANVSGASEGDVADAVASAERGMKAWQGLSLQQRYQVLIGTAAQLRASSGELARTLSMEQGKTLAEASIEVELAAETFDWYAGEVLRLYGRVLPARSPQSFQTVTPVPMGVAACFTPWNFPILLAARKVAPALAAGCAAILKPAEETVAIALSLAQCLTDAGAPAGAIAVLHGDAPRISDQLIAAPAVRTVTFTGSTAIGRVVAQTAARWLKPCVLELGGHAPVIVMDDADVPSAAATAVLGKIRNAGQVCTSPTRFFVARPVYDSFVDAFAAGMDAVRVGRGIEDGVQMGALANARRVEAADALVQDAVAKGARLLTGGQREGNQGFLYRPTVLADVPDDANVLSTEPFCPIAAIVPYDRVEDAIARANAHQAGLAGYVFGSDFAAAQAVARQLEVGQVGINSCAVSHIEATFGGAKESGYGVESSSEGMHAFLRYQYIHHLQLG